ncbi:PREDICTED: glutathione S-transferase T3-like [Camelina sativa]|uniref:Glutathione S-transferase T3-like n=1 Tax=Camelina sativa TaxID=90675 RepID=A0ABM0YY34_CAMSA|nr:PREDICTED: glutathione S-transferase T3-like [Camelina sativa]
MDPDDYMNPYHPSSSYVNLLQIQLETQNLEYSPFLSPCSEAPFEPASPQENRKSRHAWLPADDIMLVSGWLNTSKDPVRSNQQRLGAFWGRIADYIAKCSNAVGRPKREASHCKQRWGRINDLVCKFVGCYEAATREKSSGQNEDDVMKLAHEIFFNDHGHWFTLEHAWRDLRYDQKWCASIPTKGNGQPVNDIDGSQPRPQGVKVAKGKLIKTSNTQPIDVEEDGKAYLEFQLDRVSKMYEMKQKDFELKEKEFAMKKENMKHVMLDNLIAKKDSLTESEKALKDKLIQDMMSSV